MSTSTLHPWKVDASEILKDVFASNKSENARDPTRHRPKSDYPVA